jgi:hypothetical protein
LLENQVVTAFRLSKSGGLKHSGPHFCTNFVRGGVDRMTHQEEKYAHFWYCIDDLNKARRLLRDIKADRENPFCGPVFEFALIVYSKPYKQSYGTTNGTTRKHKLDERYVPVKYRDLHNRILTNRDQIHAHTDLNLREPKVHIENTSYGKTALLLLNVINVTTELKNIDSIIELIEQSLDGMYEEEKKLEAALPPNVP